MGDDNNDSDEKGGAGEAKTMRSSSGGDGGGGGGNSTAGGGVGGGGRSGSSGRRSSSGSSGSGDKGNSLSSRTKDTTASRNITAATTAYGNSTNCNMPCNGNPTQICGGPYALSLYHDPSVLPPGVVPPSPTPGGNLSTLNISRLGCWKDEFPPTGRALPNLVGASANMTVDVCAKLASAANYSVFAVQFAVECYAGNNETDARRFGLATNCDSTCTNLAANPIGTCGGPLANSLYRLTASGSVGGSDTTPPPSPAIPAPSPAPSAPSPSPAAPSPSPVVRSPSPSPALPLPSPSPSPSPAATRPSPGPAASPPAGGPRPTTTLSITPLGCWKDEFPPPGRAIPTLLLASATMTVEQCTQLAWSRGYALAALQYANECYATTNETSAVRFGLATNCDSPCNNPALDPPGSCGGGLANSLYRLPPLAPGVSPAPEDGAPPVVVPPPVVTNSPVPAGQLSTLNLTSLGCYADGDPRAIPTQLGISAGMTVDRCAQLAYASPIAYSVIGVQYAAECYAGRNETRATGYGRSANCVSICSSPSNPVGTCGGGMANSLYRLPPKPPAVRNLPNGTVYIGCFRDGDPRRGPYALGAAANMTVEECARRAVAGQYTVFAVQFGIECWGGWDLALAQSSGRLDEDSCSVLCGGGGDVCGAGGINSVYTLPPPEPPADLPAYEYLGCYADDMNLRPAGGVEPAQTISRRMFRRLAQLPNMDSWECARRAAAQGYTLFGMTNGEAFPVFGTQCWGAFNLTSVTRNGRSTACTKRCRGWPTSDMCGGDYAISLYRFPDRTYDRGIGGRFQFLTEMPVAASHIMQTTGRDEFMLIEFLDADHPPTWNRKDTSYLYFRNNNSYAPVDNRRDASCGMWHRMPDGDFMGFSGYFGASGVNEISVHATMWYHRHLAAAEDFGELAMPYGRWYGGNVLMPDGRSYVTGGDLGPGTPRALGADVWDPATKTYVGRYNSMGQNAPFLPVNPALFAASNVGGYYPGLWILPVVINPLTGEALAASPRTPKPLYWEYPLSGTQVLLRHAANKPNARSSFTFMVFGGSHEATYSSPAMGEWEEETMPGPRCQHDSAVLPNGKVVLIGGVEEGYSGLGYFPNTNNVPVNEPWIYDPEAPAGQRYRRTGVYSNIARFYHGTAVMASYGDILLAGSTVAKGFTSYHMADFDLTPYSHQEFRIEFFKPHYILGPRPMLTFVPTIVEYGSTFRVTLAANTSSSSIASLVLLLEFVVTGANELTVTAPANTFMAPPTFYLLFAVGRDDSYSEGLWFKLKGPWGTTPLSLPLNAQFVSPASTQAETATALLAGCTCHTADTSRCSAGSGSSGMSLTASSSQPVVLAGPAVNLAAGSRMDLFMWARCPAADSQANIQYVLLDAANRTAGANFDAYSLTEGVVTAKYQQFPLGGLVVNVTGAYRPALRVTGMTPGLELHLDDFEVSTITAAAYASSLAAARAGTHTTGQLATRRLQSAAQDAAAAASHAPAPHSSRLVKRLLMGAAGDAAGGDGGKNATASSNGTAGAGSSNATASGDGSVNATASSNGTAGAGSSNATVGGGGGMNAAASRNGTADTGSTNVAVSVSSSRNATASGNGTAGAGSTNVTVKGNSSMNATASGNGTVGAGSSNATAGSSSSDATISSGPGNHTVIRLGGVDSTATRSELNAYLGSMFMAPLPAFDEDVQRELEARPEQNITVLLDGDVTDIPGLKNAQHAHGH
ncbi:hypothetical protein COO60DRAFT_1701302 [Scenedesmus sp. NREL 46B-D3]|nr:hypothetical protein COO60DRAFT_1701302 [Scenedesmus sp. NREL 46B-D3]